MPVARVADGREVRRGVAPLPEETRRSGGEVGDDAGGEAAVEGVDDCEGAGGAGGARWRRGAGAGADGDDLVGLGT